MNIGEKIRVLRELKKVSPKVMADALDLSQSGYSKIERDEVKVDIDKLVKMADVLGMKPEDILAFDEKIVFNNSTLNSSASFNYGHIVNQFPEKLQQLYEDKIKLLEEKIISMQKEIDRLS